MNGKVKTNIFELKRLERLRSYHVLDTEREMMYDNIVLMASKICDVPTSLISLVDEKRQWFKARVGLDQTETSREVSFCQYAMLDDGVFVVEDALKDTRFNQNALVTGNPKIRFYAGVPLVDFENYPLGALCVIDYKPRKLSTHQLELLSLLSKQVMFLFQGSRDEKKLVPNLTTLKLSENIPGMLYQFCMDDKDQVYFPFSSNKIEDIFEVKANEVKENGDLVFSRIHPDDVEGLRASVHKSRDELTDWDYEFRVNLPDKGVRYLKGRSHPEKLLNNKVIWHGYIYDCTEEKKKQNLLEQYGKVVAMGEIAAGIAHEIKGPLMAMQHLQKQLNINLESKALSLGELNLGELKIKQEKMSQYVDRLLKIVKGLSYLSGHHEKEEFEECSIDDLVQHSIEIAVAKSPTKKCVIKFNNLCRDEGKFFCRPVEMAQVLINLISNSLDAISELDDQWIHISSFEDKNKNKVFEIVDSGLGIESSVEKKMMEPYFTTKKRNQGTGLGLSISSRIIKEHAGELSYQLKDGHTSFTIKIPHIVVQSKIA